MSLVIYGLRGEHTYTYTHTHTHTLPHESDFRKPGACWPAPGLKITMAGLQTATSEP